MLSIRSYLVNLLSRIIYDTAIAFWEEPIPEKILKKRVDSVLKEVRNTVIKMAMQDSRFDKKSSIKL